MLIKNMADYPTINKIVSGSRPIVILYIVMALPKQ